MTYVRYRPDPAGPDRVLDLARLGGDDFRLVTGLARQLRRGDRVLLCLPGDRTGDGELYVQDHVGGHRAVHFDHRTHEPGHPVSARGEHHRRQQDYWTRAADEAGLPTAREVRTPADTILDVAIAGPRGTGVELRRTDVTAAEATADATASYRSGWLPVWFADADHTPAWFHHVPSVGCNRVSWDDLPSRRSATATGLRTITAARCAYDDFGRCPESHRGPCGRYHPKPVPLRGLTIDDVAAMVPAGELEPLVEQHGYVYLVPPRSRRVFEELTGEPGAYAPDTVLTDTGPAPLHCTRCGQRLGLLRPGRNACQGCRPLPMTQDYPY
ncbi:hypothetical protein V5P93_003717 [Actinokineospora auranticolor]|uniref:hypothetical protein n=1 Tax=Actinokineospora auranticolor TaxID=155976 RepID=UPI000CECC82F|nr:hypothetical protein [Actinokineospora auranticolor]